MEAEPVICDCCLAEGTTATFADWSFRGPENELHDQWLCPACVRVAEDAMLSELEDA